MRKEKESQVSLLKILFVTTLLLLGVSGCSEAPAEEVPEIAGNWTSYSESYHFYNDGSYTITFHGRSVNGTYTISKKDHILILRFAMNNADRERRTGYSLDNNGSTLMLEQSQLGVTVVLKRIS